MDVDAATGRFVLAPEAVAAGQAFISCKEGFIEGCTHARTGTIDILASIRRQVLHGKRNFRY